MASKREKGLAFQRWIKKFLEGRDWIVHNQTPTGRMIKIKGKTIYVSQKNDIMGSDLIARQWDTVYGFTRLIWIQATLDSNVQKRVDEFRKYFKSTMYHEDLQIWMKTKSGEINIKRVIILDTEVSVQDYGKIIRGKFYQSERPNNVI